MSGQAHAQAVERRTTCFPKPGTQDVVQDGDYFRHELARLYSASESSALEALLLLKAKLCDTATHEFWSELASGLSDILGAEMKATSIIVADRLWVVYPPPAAAEANASSHPSRLAVPVHQRSRATQ